MIVRIKGEKDVSLPFIFTLDLRHKNFSPSTHLRGV